MRRNALVVGVIVDKALIALKDGVHETREQLIQSPVKMGQLMHSPMKMEQLTLPQETRPN